jgi:hypothetical protein
VKKNRFRLIVISGRSNEARINKIKRIIYYINSDLSGGSSQSDQGVKFRYHEM